MGSKPAFNTFKKKAEERHEDPVLFFLSAGLDYHGQSQLAYTANGWGLASSVKIDPGKIIGLQAEVGVSGGVNRAKEALVMALRGPNRLAFTTSPSNNPTPLALLSMVGVIWEGEIGAELNVGVSFKAKAEAGVSSSGGEAEAKIEDDEEEDEAFKLDTLGVGASFEAQAGFAGSAGYKYHHLYAEDIAPRFFACKDGSKDGVREMLSVVFNQGSVKQHVKKAACDFINANSRYFGKVSYATFFGHTGSEEIIKKLRAGKAVILAPLTASAVNAAFPGQFAIKTANQHPMLDLAQQTENHISNLLPFVEGKESRGMCFLRLSSHSPKAEAGFKAMVDVKAELSNVGAVKAGAALKGPTVEIEGKRAYMRYQTYFKEGERFLMCTQDTLLNYANVTGTLLGLNVEAGAESALLGKSASKDGGKSLSKTLSRMTYASSIVYWERPSLERLNQTKKFEATTTALPGSGIRLGQSCLISSLCKLARPYSLHNWWQKKYAQRLAKSLNITVKQLMAFIDSPEVKLMLESLRDQDQALAQAKRRSSAFSQDGYGDGWHEKAVLVETSFTTPDAFGLKINCERKTNRNLFSANTHEDYALVKTDVRGELLKSSVYGAGRDNHLQAIRLRYRINDISEEDKERFSLGFKVMGQELGISLKSVDRAGSEGIVDVATVWMKNGKAAQVGTAGAEEYEKSVPPAVLFCQ